MKGAVIAAAIAMAGVLPGFEASAETSFSADGRYLVTSGLLTSDVIVWDADTNGIQRIRPSKFGRGAFTESSISSDSSNFVVAFQGQLQDTDKNALQLSVYSVGSPVHLIRNTIIPLEGPNYNNLTNVFINKTGTSIIATAAGVEPFAIKQSGLEFNKTSGKVPLRARFTNSDDDETFLLSSSLIASYGAITNTIKTFNVKTGKMGRSIPLGCDAFLLDVSFDAIGVGCSDPSVIRFFDKRTVSQIFEWPLDDSGYPPLMGLAMSVDRSTAAVVDSESIQLIDISSSTIRWTARFDPRITPTGDISISNNLVAVGVSVQRDAYPRYIRSLHIYDMNTGRVVRTIQ